MVAKGSDLRSTSFEKAHREAVGEAGTICPAYLIGHSPGTW